MPRFLRSFGRLRLTALVLSALAVGGTAIAATREDPTGVTSLATESMRLSVADAVARPDCAIKRLTGAGTTTVAWTPKKTAALTFSLANQNGQDWDLAVFDHATGSRVGGSGVFAGDDIVQTYATAGRTFDVQACRVSGRSSTATLAVRGVELPKVTPRTGPAPTESLVKIDVPTRKAFKTLETLGVDLGEDASPEGVSAVLHSTADTALLEKAGFTFTTQVADLAAADRKARAADRRATIRAGAAGSALPSGRTTYRTLADVLADLKKVVQEHPAIAKPVALPVKTFQGRTTQGVELSSNVNATDDQKPVTFIMGLHHAREWPAAENVTEFALYLSNGYGTDPEITNLLNTVRVVIVPVINSDGYIASRETPVPPAESIGDPGGAPSLAEAVAPPFGGTLQYRRKNCDGASPNPATPCELQYGVDPNRNYGELWGGFGASTDTGSQSYRGTGQWSEPETQAVHLYSQRRPVNSLLTMHNFASLVLRPPGTSGNGLAPDEERLKAIGDQMGDDTGYTSQYSYQLYDTSGTTEDWNYGAAGTYGYTMELGPTSAQGGNFHVAYQQGVIDQWTGTGTRKGRGVRAALMTLASSAASQKDFSTVAGYAPAGRVIRLKKTFKTFTSPICTVASPVAVDPTALDPTGTSGGATDCVAPTAATSVDDVLDYTTTIGANGRFAWLVPPSTKPFVAKKGGTEAYTLTCEDAAGKVFESRAVTIARGQRQTLTLPCGTSLPAAATTTTPVGTPPPTSGAKDKLAPQSRFTRAGLRATRKGVQLAGTSVDFAPATLPAEVAAVRVALGRRTGKLCQYVTAAGRFGPKVSCLRTSYLPALGTGTWTFLYKHKLPKGKYLAWVRGRDAAGNIERKAKARNLTTFTIR